jgi:chromosome segregation ATPase
MEKADRIRDRKIAAIDQRLKKVEVRQMITDQKFEDLTVRVEKTERNLRFLTETVSKLDARLERLETRFDDLEKRVTAQIAKLDAKTDLILNRLDSFLGLYQKHDVEIGAVKSSVARHERIMPQLAASA